MSYVKNLTGVGAVLLSSLIALNSNGITNEEKFPGSIGSGGLNTAIFPEENPGGSEWVTIIGHKEQTQAPIININGSMLFEANEEKISSFAGLLSAATGNINWSFAEGYLPESIHTFKIPNFDVQIKYFAYPRTYVNPGIWGGDFVLVYARVQLTYNGNDTSSLTLPIKTIVNGTAKSLAPLSAISGLAKECFDLAECKKPATKNQVFQFDYAVASERLTGPSNGSHSLTDSEVKAIAGSFDAVEQEFKTYWNKALEGLPRPILPSTYQNAADLNNALKVAMVHFNIIRDHDRLKTPIAEQKREIKGGENGYDMVYDHDAHGILASAIELGAVSKSEAITLLKDLPISTQIGDGYLDSYGKIVWAAAKLAHKFNPTKAELNRILFTDLHTFDSGNQSLTLSDAIHFFADRKISSDDLAIVSNTLDSDRRNVVDNLSFLLGIKSYEYLYNKAKAGESSSAITQEKQWINSQFNRVSNKLQTQLLSLVANKPEKDKYISALVNKLTEDDDLYRFDNGNANAFSPFWFGRMYELFLFGSELENIKPYIDNTLDVAIKNSEKLRNANGEWNGSYGSYPESNFTAVTTGYNACYSEGFLVGKGKYRDVFYKSFDLLMNYQSGPYSWYENIGVNKISSNLINGRSSIATHGNGSSPHLWSAASQARLFVHTLISEKFNGDILLGRGVPKSWSNSDRYGIENYTLSDRSQMGYTIKRNSVDSSYTLQVTGRPTGKVVLNLPIFIDYQPVIKTYSGAPSNYLSLVTVADSDSDGIKELVVDKTFDFSKPIIFTLTIKDGSVGGKFRIKEVDLTPNNSLDNIAANIEKRPSDKTVDATVLPIIDGNNLWHSAMWIAEKVASAPNHFLIKNFFTGEYLNIEFSAPKTHSLNTPNNAGVLLKDWHSAHWSFQFNGTHFVIKNRWRGECLSRNAAKLAMNNCSPEGKWLLEEVIFP